MTEVTFCESNRLNTSILNCSPSAKDGAHATFMSKFVVQGRRPAVPRGTGRLLQRMNEEPYGCGSYVGLAGSLFGGAPGARVGSRSSTPRQFNGRPDWTSRFTPTDHSSVIS